MTSFAVQTVAGIFSRISENQLDKARARTAWKDPDKWKPSDEETAEPEEKDIVSHAEFVTRKRKELDKKFGHGENHRTEEDKPVEEKGDAKEHRKRRESSPGSKTMTAEVEKHEEKGAERLSTEEERPDLSAKLSPGEQSAKDTKVEHHLPNDKNPDNDAASAHSGAEMEDEDQQLTIKLLDTAAELERVARRLLISNLPPGSSAQILLKADWHVQLQEMRAVLHQEANDAADRQAERDQTNGGGPPSKEEEEGAMRERVDREAELVLMPLDGREAMKAIRRYRECFATMLVIGSRLRKLKGREQFLFERRQGLDDDML